MEKDNKPSYNMYAIIDNGIVIDCGFGYDTEYLISPITKNEYIKNNTYKFIQCTETSGSFFISQKIDEVI